MTYTPVEADPSEKKVWDDFKANGRAVTPEGDVITGLIFWREDGNTNFVAGYEGSEEYNIPDPVLESICPGRNIWWNSSEQSHTAMGTGTLFSSNATEADMKAIEAVFVAYGFKVL